MRRPTFLFLLLVLALAAVAPAAAQSISTYRISNVLDVQTRSAIAATGANIFEVGRGYVLVEANSDEARALGRLGFTLEPQPSIQAFPPADSNYHDYAEMAPGRMDSRRVVRWQDRPFVANGPRGRRDAPVRWHEPTGCTAVGASPRHQRPPPTAIATGTDGQSDAGCLAAGRPFVANGAAVERRPDGLHPGRLVVTDWGVSTEDPRPERSGYLDPTPAEIPGKRLEQVNLYILYSDSEFLIEDASVLPENQARVRFVADAQGAITELQLLVSDGRVFPRARKKLDSAGTYLDRCEDLVRAVAGAVSITCPPKPQPSSASSARACCRSLVSNPSVKAP